MKVKNISKRTYNHSYYEKDNKFVTINLAPNAVDDIEKEVAEKWLKTGEVIEYVQPEEAKNLQEENEALKKEIEKLKAEKEGQQKDAPELEALKKEADELGIQYAKNIGLDTLQKKIEEFKNSQNK